MRRGTMWLRNALAICGVIAAVLGQDDIITKAQPGQEFVQYESSLGNSGSVQGRAIPIEEFVTSHKIPEGVPQPSEADDEEDVVAMEAELAKEVLQRAAAGNLDKRAEKKKIAQQDSKRQARVQLENFSDTGVLSKDGIKKIELARAKVEGQSDAIIPGVEVSAENPTTMSPVLTTPREVRAFDFVPVNIIHEDNKESYTPYADRHIGDLSDVSLVPAGSNSRIQVKKGPNGKDYEYEYVYYYYDEEDEGKAGTQTNSHDGPARTTVAPAAPKRGSTNGRNKYSSIDRTTTVEPASNEIIPSRTSAKSRQIPEAEDVSEERLPANTRFPPRSRSNHNTGTTEPSRARGNRPRPSLDLVDSSSFRTHQEGPEFPQNLPKGPLRFLGVTPHEESEEKPATRGRTRPSKVHEPAPVEEPSEEPVVPHRRRPVTAKPEVEVELNRGQPIRPSVDESEEDEPTSSPAPAVKSDSASVEDKAEENGANVQNVSKEQDVLETSTTEVPTTENPSAMDKVALDLYAFLLQGQSNLVDSSTADVETDDATTPTEDDGTTDVPTTTEVLTTTTELATTTEPTTTTTTTTTTEAPTTTTQLPTGRGKFRRPGTPVGTRNRFKSNTPSTTTSEAPPAVEHTPRPRSRFGAASGGFKRPRPGHRQAAEQPAVEEDAQKESSSSVNNERPSLPPRGRFRGAGTRPTTTAPAAPTPSEQASSSSSSSAETPNSSVVRPGFNRLNLNRRRGRPTTPATTTSEDVPESGETVQTDSHETVSTTARSTPRPRLPGTGPRTLRPGPRINLRLRPGLTTSTTAAPETPEPSAEEPAGAGTEEESHEAPAETSPSLPTTPESPLTRLRNRNRLQVHPKAPRVVTPPAPRRSPLLPRRRTTEAPIVETSSEATSAEESEDEPVPTETAPPETSTAASQKQEEARGLSSLLAPRRRIAPRRPGQLISRE